MDARSRAPVVPDLRRRFRIGVLFVIVLALALRVIHLFEIRGMPFAAILVGDAQGYDRWARAIVAGDWIGHETFYQAPLYPYFLATLYKIFGATPWVARIAQAMLGAASCGVLALAGRAWFSTRAGLAAGVLIAVYPPSIFFDGILQKATLDLVFMALTLWLLGEIARDRSGGWILAVGAAIGGFALSRENALVFAPVVATWLALRALANQRTWQQRIKEIGLFTAGLALLLLPVGLRNRAVGGEFLMTTAQSGPNFYIGNNAEANGRYVPLRPGRETFETERIDATELAEAALGRKLSAREVSGYWWDRALSFIRDKPAAWARLLGLKLLLVWNRVELPDTESFGLHREFSASLRIPGAVLGFGTLLMLAAAGVVFTWPERRRLVLLHALLATLAAAVAAFYVFARYRYPLVPILALFAGAAIAEIVTNLRREPERGPARRRFVVAAVAAGIALIVASLPVAPAADSRAGDYANVGSGFAAAGRFEEALAWYSRTLEIRPDDPETLYDRAVALAALGRREEARTTYQRVLTLAPSHAPAHANLGIMLAEDGELAAARHHLEEAARLDPRSAMAKSNLGTLAALEGRTEDAERLWTEAAAADRSNIEARLNLARMLADTGRAAQAAQRYREVLAIRPDNAEAKDGLKALGQNGLP